MTRGKSDAISAAECSDVTDSSVSTELETAPFERERKSVLPCSVSEVLRDTGTDSSAHGFAFTCGYQVCDYQGNLQYASSCNSIGEGSLATGCELRVQGSAGTAYKAREKESSEFLLYAVMFPHGLSLVHRPYSYTLRDACVHANNDISRIVHAQLMNNTHLADVITAPGSSLYTSAKPRILLLRKDEVREGRVVRRQPRPLQLAPGTFLDL